MDTEASNLAFKTAVNEIKNTCPGISNVFIFDGNRQVITQDENTSQELINCTADSLTSVLRTAAIADGLDSFTCAGSSQKISFTRYEDNYFVTFASTETDERTLTTLVRVMVPSMLRLAQEVVTSRKHAVAETPELKTPVPTSISTPAPTLATAPTIQHVSSPPSAKVQNRIKSVCVDLPASEFTVENLSGINIISSDPETVYVDRALLGEWKELYGDYRIERASVESIISKKKIKCRFQPIKSQKFEGQNIILIPNRIQNKLEIKTGSAILIRPIIEEGEK